MASTLHEKGGERKSSGSRILNFSSWPIVVLVFTALALQVAADCPNPKKPKLCTLSEGALCLGNILKISEESYVPNKGPFCKPGLTCVFLNGDSKGRYPVVGVGRCVKRGAICPHGIRPVYCTPFPDFCHEARVNTRSPYYKKYYHSCGVDKGYKCYLDVCNNCATKFVTPSKFPVVESAICESIFYFPKRSPPPKRKSPPPGRHLPPPPVKKHFPPPPVKKHAPPPPVKKHAPPPPVKKHAPPPPVKKRAPPPPVKKRAPPPPVKKRAPPPPVKKRAPPPPVKKRAPPPPVKKHAPPPPHKH